MSSWANKINELERANKRFRHLEGWKPQHSAAIKFLKTNPTKHQLLAHIKKHVDQFAKNANKKPDTADLLDLKSIVLDAQEDLRISDNYIYKLSDLIFMMEDFLLVGVHMQRVLFPGGKWEKSAWKKFHTAHKREMAKPNRNRVRVDVNVSRAAKKWKIRLTNDTNGGKRVKRTETELKKLIEAKEKACKARHGNNHHYCNK